MSFREFAATVAQEESLPKESQRWRYYLQAPLVWNDSEQSVYNQMAVRAKASEDSSVPTTGVHESTMPGVALAPLDDAVRSDLKTRVAWKWLDAARSLAGCPQFDSATLWAGHGGGCTPLHVDHVSNFFTQLAGRKRMLLFPPSQRYHLYPYPVHHPAGNDFSMVDVEDLDLERFPAVANARGYEVSLEAGDVLFLPARWWHYVRQCDPGHENLSLNFWVNKVEGSPTTTSVRLQHALERAAERPPPAAEIAMAARAAAEENTKRAALGTSQRQKRDLEDDALLQVWADESQSEALVWTHLAVMIEGSMTDHLGAAEAGAFLNDLAAGVDATDGKKWPAGSLHREAASSLRGQLISILGGAERANALLRLMTRHCRLFPGLAPTVSGPIVNSEAGEHTSREEVKRMRAIANGALAKSSSPFL